MEEVDKQIIAKILEADPDTWIIFYREGCPYCDRARDKLRTSEVKYKAYDINKDIGGKNVLLKALTDHKDEINFDTTHTTVPIVFYNKIFIGGSDKLIELLNK